jgi:hypothetical protein
MNHMKTPSATPGIHPLEAYIPGLFERFGRRIKVEYLGMASVYSIIALLFFGDFSSWYKTILATLGAFFLFLGLKKKTEDHLVGSLVLFAAVSVAQGPIHFTEWVVPYMLFGLAVFIMEGYRGRRPTRVYALPAVFLGWSLADSSWWLGLAFAALYLAVPRAEEPHVRRHLAYMVMLSLLLGFSAHALSYGSIGSSLQFFPSGHVALDRTGLEVLVAIGVPTLLCLALYWKRLVAPHRWNTLLFACLAPWDGRLAALFGMVAAVLLCATVFRDSVDSPTMRPFFKHFEWHYFWYVFAVALWAVLSRWGITSGWLV